MNIYRHCVISEAMGLQNIFELVPDFDYEQVPKDATFCGPISPFKGHKHTKEHKKYISGEGNGMFGKTHSKESREKMSKAMKGKKRKPFTKETKRKMSENAKRRRKKILPNGKWTWEYID